MLALAETVDLVDEFLHALAVVRGAGVVRVALQQPVVALHGAQVVARLGAGVGLVEQGGIAVAAGKVLGCQHEILRVVVAQALPDGILEARGRGAVIPQLHQRAPLLVAGEPQVDEPLQGGELPACVRGAVRLDRGFRLLLCLDGPWVAGQQQRHQQPGPGEGPAPAKPHQEQGHGRKHQHIAAVQPGQGAVLDDHEVTVDTAVDAPHVTVVHGEVEVAAPGIARQLLQ